MTTTPPEAPAGQPGEGRHDGGPRVTGEQVRDLGRLRRSATDRKVAGVAGGLGRHLDVDPLVLRVLFVVLAFFGGAGLILYGACWLLVPDESDESAMVTLDDRSRTVALMIVGLVAVVALVGDSWGAFWFPWPLAIVALVVWLLLNRRDRRLVGPPPGAGGPYAASYGAAPPAPGQVTGQATGQAYGQTTPAGPAGYAAPPAPGEAGGAGATGTQPTWTTPVPPTVPPVYYAPPAPPRDPRKRGPVLFWFTLALIVFCEGVLGILDLAGAAVADAAYPALAVGIVGLMLVVGAFWGRAGGLIFLGLVSTIGLVGATAADQYEGRSDYLERPDTAAEVQDSYSFGAGDYVLDLTAVQDPENLDGRSIRVEGGIGRIEVVLPDGLDVDAEGRVGGPGAVTLFGDEVNGVASTLQRDEDVTDEVAALSIDAQLGVGEIEVNTK